MAALGSLPASVNGRHFAGREITSVGPDKGLTLYHVHHSEVYNWISGLAHHITGRPNKTFLGDLETNNGSWLIRHRKFQTWLEAVSPPSPRLWVCGEPGT